MNVVHIRPSSFFNSSQPTTDIDNRNSHCLETHTRAALVPLNPSHNPFTPKPT